MAETENRAPALFCIRSNMRLSCRSQTTQLQMYAQAASARAMSCLNALASRRMGSAFWRSGNGSVDSAWSESYSGRSSRTWAAVPASKPTRSQQSADHAPETAASAGRER